MTIEIFLRNVYLSLLKTKQQNSTAFVLLLTERETQVLKTGLSLVHLFCLLPVVTLDMQLKLFECPHL